jgi:hypothetical protein
MASTPASDQRRVIPDSGRAGSHVKIPRTFPIRPIARAMDIERINQIGALLADLAARTGALRGYL